jgi:hypothetical protein
MSTEQQFAAWLIFGLIALLLFAGGQWSAIWSVIGNGGGTTPPHQLVKTKAGLVPYDISKPPAATVSH